MSRPTPESVAYRWHTEAIAGRAAPMHEGSPQCGWFRRPIKRGTRKGWVAAKITLAGRTDPETGDLIEDERHVCEVDGRVVDAEQEWTWVCGQPITEMDYLDLLAAGFIADENETPF